MNQHDLEAEVLQLTLLWQQGDASDEERARLERLLLDFPQARELYLQFTDDTITLADVAQPLRDSESPRESRSLTTVETGPRSVAWDATGEKRWWQRRVSGPTRLALGALVACVITALFGPVMTNWPDP
ncbi:MAG: hypothetical protein KDA60_07865, partial [Planctomycetales bacterium]|nr:hypothetical protein [Planctomycetales bacterium]